MNSKKIYFLMISGLLIVSGCKNEGDATSKIDPKAKEIAPASADAVEPSVAPTQAQGQTQQPTQVQGQNQTTTNVTMPPVNTNATQMSFNKKVHDFGTINQGDKVNYTFSYTNTGKKDLIITNATGSCGCTVPEYSKVPLKPGKSAKMKVSFDSTGKTGEQSKTVSIMANVPNGMETLTIKASIKGGEAKAVPVTTTEAAEPVEAAPALAQPIEEIKN
jgi:hypothetical protein